MLLVLSVVVVGVALIKGLDTYAENNKTFDRDAANAALVELASKAIAYRQMPAILNGGKKADGSTSFSGITMDALGADARISEGGGYDLLGDGSCFTGHATPDGNEFRAAWYPNGDCDTSNNVVLKMTVAGVDLNSITVEAGGYAAEWLGTE